jgi:ATP-dependent DNA ligase
VGWRSRPRWAVTRFDDANMAALKLPQEDFVIDGETVVVGLDGGSDFGALHSGRHNERAQFYAFDMLAGDGEGQRQLALSLRKTNSRTPAQAPHPRHIHRRVRAGRNRPGSILRRL